MAGDSVHLLQDRFKSEPCNDSGYFLTLFRYIHQNPFPFQNKRSMTCPPDRLGQIGETGQKVVQSIFFSKKVGDCFEI